MKKIIFTLFLLILVSFLSPENLHASINKQVRDSIFHAADSIPVDSLRSLFLRKAFQQYIGQESATEYLDSALTLCIRKGLHEEELWTLYDYCRHYEYRSDLPNMEKRLSLLKKASYQYKIYDYYYTIWLSTLRIRCSLGDTEYVIMKAKEMKIEAIRLKYKGGIFIAALVLAETYDTSGQYNKAAAAYKQILIDNPTANNNALIIIYGKLSKIFYKQKKYSEALNALQSKLDILIKISKDIPSSGSFNSTFLEIEISFCRIYMETKDEKQLNTHLKRAQKYYEQNDYIVTYIEYHALWAAYYKITKEWNKSLKEINLALSSCRGNHPFYENGILKMKASILMEAGLYKEAAEAYKMAAIKGDSLNLDILNRHKEVHQASYKIRKALLEKEELKKRSRYIQVGAGSIILILLIFAIMRAIHIRRELILSEEKTRQAFETAKAADKMKERFLHNITYEIRIPLNTVVGFSELLSSENDLTDEEIEEYSVTIKKNSTKLLTLINNILDLSRLEAGMMRFIVQECEVVQLCREAKMIVEMQKPGLVKPIFKTKLDSLQLNVDSKWFLRLLTTLLSVPNDYVGEPRKTEYTLSEESKQLIIVVKGSPLYQCWEDEQEQHILHGINTLYVETFKGNYKVLEQGKEKVVYITFPIV